MEEDCLMNKVWKKSTSQMANNFDDPVDHYMKLYEHEKPKKPDIIDSLLMCTLHGTVINAIPRNNKAT